MNIIRKMMLAMLAITIIIMTLCLNGGNVMYIITNLFIFSAIYLYSRKFDQHFAVVVFLINFFVFLMSSEFVKEVFSFEKYEDITIESINHAFFVLFIGVLFLLIGYRINIKKILKSNECNN